MRKELLVFYFCAIVRRASAALRSWHEVFHLMFLLIIMLNAGVISLKLVDSRDGHKNPLFVGTLDDVESWIAFHEPLCTNGRAAVRGKLGELDGMPVGYTVTVVYSPVAVRRPWVQTDFGYGQGSL